MTRLFWRWAAAVFIVSPLMLLIVPLAHRWFFELEGPHADASVPAEFMSMVGFYGGYTILAATIGSLAHTAILRKRQWGTWRQLVLAVMVGVVVLVPQGFVFGRTYLAANALAGGLAGLLYWGVVTSAGHFRSRRANPMDSIAG